MKMRLAFCSLFLALLPVTASSSNAQNINLNCFSGLPGVNAWAPCSPDNPIHTGPAKATAIGIPTYGAGDVNIANTGAGDVMCIYGSSTKTVAVNRIHMTATATSAIVVNASVIKRSAVEGNDGTPVSETVVPFDSTMPAGTATVTGYTVSPTSGAAVGTISAHKMAIGVQGNTATTTEAEHNYGQLSDTPIILRGTTQGVCVNVGAAGTGGSWAINIRWTEN